MLSAFVICPGPNSIKVDPVGVKVRVNGSLFPRGYAGPGRPAVVAFIIPKRPVGLRSHGVGIIAVRRDVGVFGVRESGGILSDDAL